MGLVSVEFEAEVYVIRVPNSHTTVQDGRGVVCVLPNVSWAGSFLVSCVVSSVDDSCKVQKVAVVLVNVEEAIKGFAGLVVLRRMLCQRRERCVERRNDFQAPSLL